MKYCAAYLMLVLGGNETPSAADIKKVLESVEAEYEEDVAQKLVSELEGKQVHEIIATGREKLKAFGGGGGGGGPAAAADAPASGQAASKEAAKVVEEEEEEEDVDFDLFG